MSTSATLLRFAAELSLFVVSVAGLVFAARPGLVAERRSSRARLALGFGVLAVSAFLHGSLVIDRTTDRPAAAALRLSAVALVALGSMRWTAGTVSRAVLWAGLVLVAVAEAAHALDRSTVADIVVASGALLVGAALVATGRRSIPARFGTNAAVLLLAVVLAVSVTLSLVLTRNVEDEAARRYGSRTEAEAARTVSLARETLVPARLLAGSLTGGREPELASFVAEQPDPAAQAEARTNIDQALALITAENYFAIRDPVVYVSPGGVPEAASPADLDNTTRLALAGSRVVAEAVEERGDRQTVTVIGDKAYAVAAVALTLPSATPASFAGVVVVAHPIDDTYLRLLETAGEPMTFALVTATDVLARSEPLAWEAVLREVGREVLDRGATPTGVVDGRFLVGRPVEVAGRPPDLALVTAVPTSAVNDTRDALFRSLFVVALASTLFALLLAFFVGDRIGRRLSRLTMAAERIRTGDLDAKASVRGDDEVGVLGATFDAMAGSLRDLTDDLRRAVEDEARLRGRIETVIDGMGEALLAVDERSVVTDCNPAAVALLGRSADDTLGRPVRKVLVTATGPVDAPAGGVSHSEMELVTPGGPVPVAVTAAPLRVAGSLAGGVFLLRDLRGQHELEEMKTTFLANIGHELRSPLTPIKGYAGVLQRKTLATDQVQRFAREISTGVDQLERVIGQLVNFATFVAGRLEVRAEPVVMAPMLDRVAARWTQRSGVPHPVVVDPDIERVTVEVDPRYLEQALDELIDNAVKYSPDGSPVVLGAALVLGRADAVDRAPARRDGTAAGAPAGNGLRGNGASSNGHSNGDGAGRRSRSVEISVTDQGVGIDPGRLAELVGEFAQGDASETRTYGGLGLGLALADRIARAHGGTLTCRSTPGAGARFSIVIPVDVVAPEAVRT